MPTRTSASVIGWDLASNDDTHKRVATAAQSHVQLVPGWVHPTFVQPFLASTSTSHHICLPLSSRVNAPLHTQIPKHRRHSTESRFQTLISTIPHLHHPRSEVSGQDDQLLGVGPPPSLPRAWQPPLRVSKQPLNVSPQAILDKCRQISTTLSSSHSHPFFRASTVQYVLRFKAVNRSPPICEGRFTTCIVPHHTQCACVLDS